jgi:hypothetical protein
VPSVKDPVAVNAWVCPFATVGLTGVTAIPTRAAGVTLSVALPVIDPSDAEIVVEPTLLPEAWPVVSIDATAPSTAAQETFDVMS